MVGRVQEDGKQDLAVRPGHQQIAIEQHGHLPDGAANYVHAAIAPVVQQMPGYSSARIKLGVLTSAEILRPAIAQVVVNAGGQPVRGHVAAGTLRQAGDLLAERLTEQRLRLSGRRVARHWPEAVERRMHCLMPLPRPAPHRDIVRRKQPVLAQCTPDEAALVMDLMDYDFHLFTDIQTGEDSTIIRIGPTGYRLARAYSTAPHSGPNRVRMSVSVYPAPRLRTQQAIERLEFIEMPWLFFINAETERGNVLYHRCDGNYAVLAPGSAPYQLGTSAA